MGSTTTSSETRMSEYSHGSSTIGDYDCITANPLWKEVERQVERVQRLKQMPNRDGFLAKFSREINRVQEFVDAQNGKHEIIGKRLLAKIDLVKGDSARQDISKLEAKTKRLVESYCSFQEFEMDALKDLTKIAHHADDVLGTNSLQILKENLVLTENKNSAFVVVLSDIFEAIRKFHNETKFVKWVATQNLERGRATTKYCTNDRILLFNVRRVDSTKMMKLLLSIVSEAPLLIRECTCRLTSKAKLNRSEGDKLWKELASTVCSVYYDSPDRILYKERVARHAGAQLFRVRWEGDERPHGDQLIFLEFKMFHEKWANSKSVKERVAIREKDMGVFLSPNPLKVLDAEVIVRDANPSLAGHALDFAIALLLEMHGLVLTLGLRPYVRTKYKRVVFQSSKSYDKIRLTVDHNIIMIDETSTPRGSWCLTDENIIPTMITSLPVDVFEVEVAGNTMPEVIQSLERDEVILEAEHFSKFLTGAATCKSTNVGLIPSCAAFSSSQNMLAARSARGTNVCVKPKEKELFLRSDTSETFDESRGSFSKHDSLCTNTPPYITEESISIRKKRYWSHSFPSFLKPSPTVQ